MFNDEWEKFNEENTRAQAKALILAGMTMDKESRMDERARRRGMIAGSHSLATGPVPAPPTDPSLGGSSGDSSASKELSPMEL